MILNISKDSLYEICQYLDFKSIGNLTLTCKEMLKNIKKCKIKPILRTLKFKCFNNALLTIPYYGDKPFGYFNANDIKFIFDKKIGGKPGNLKKIGWADGGAIRLEIIGNIDNLDNRHYVIYNEKGEYTHYVVYIFSYSSREIITYVNKNEIYRFFESKGHIHYFKDKIHQKTINIKREAELNYSNNLTCSSKR